jgi:hypothetical protein
MHDFDTAQRERQQRLTDEFGTHQFTLRGETFTIRRIIPVAVLRQMVGVNSDTSTDADAFTAAYDAVMSMLATQDDRDRFETLCNDIRSDFPVTFTDLLEIQTWMIQEASGRPPTQPSSSSESPSTNGQNGTAG